MISLPFLEGLSLRQLARISWSPAPACGFPFLLGRAFIEATAMSLTTATSGSFSFLFGGAFFEAQKALSDPQPRHSNSLPFWEGFL